MLKICKERYSILHLVDILFVQECSKTNNSPTGYRIDTINSLRKSCRKLTSKEYTIGFVNLVNIDIPHNKKPCKIDVTKCRNMMKQVIQKCNPKYIIPLGSLPTTELTGKRKFKDWVGRIISIDKYKVIPIYHPDFAIKSKQRQRDYEIQIQNLIKQIAGKHIIENKKYTLLIDENSIIKCLNWLWYEHGREVQSFDYETTDLDPDKGVPVCLSISYKKNQGFCLYFFDIETYRDIQYNHKLTDNIKTAIKKWMLRPISKIAQSAKFEIKWTKAYFDCEPNNIIGDTKQIHHLLNEETSSRLSDLAYFYTDMGGYDIPMQEFLDDEHKHWEAEPNFMLKYSAGDADCTRQIYMKQIEMLKKDYALNWLHNHIVNPAIYTLARIEDRGMKIDFKKMMKVKVELEDRIEVIMKKANDYTAVKNTIKHLNENKIKSKQIKHINFNSSKQVQYLLYEELGLPVLNESKKTKLPSTDSNTLELLKDRHPVVDNILKIRSYAYQLTDIDQIKEKMRTDYTVYSDLTQDYVVTGRLSSRNPNLQNIKLGTEDEPSLVKECFISRFEGGEIIQADESQLELRLMGSESKEPKFIMAFKNGIDIHGMTAEEINKPRPKAKRINFGSAYGITEYGLSKQLNISVEEAKEVLREYWSKFIFLRKWMKGNVQEAIENLQVRSKLGRIRHLPDINSSKWWLRESAEKSASNFKIQSLGADITMWCMVEIDIALIECGYKSIVVGQIHDSVIVDAHPDELNQVMCIMKNTMEEGAMGLFTFLTIPLKTDIEIGERWSELEPCDV